MRRSTLPGRTTKGIVTRTEYNQLLDYIEWLSSVAVTGVGPGLVTVPNIQGRSVALGTARVGDWFFAKITAATAATTDRKWYYSWSEVEKSGAGYTANTWSVKSGGKSGASDNADTRAYNLKEYSNTGTLSNGLATSHLLGTFKPVAIPNGTIVKMYAVTRSDSGATEYWFDEPIAMDGGCSSAGL